MAFLQPKFNRVKFANRVAGRSFVSSRHSLWGTRPILCTSKTVCTFRLQSVERPAEGHAIISYSNKEGETRKDGRKESEASKASEVCSPGKECCCVEGMEMSNVWRSRGPNILW